MKIWILTMCIGIASCHPSVYRLKRETSSASSGESTSTSTTSPSSSSSTPSPSRDGSNQFGLGAAAGIGGIGSSAGIGNFQADTRKNPFLPFGAFAGLNLGQGGRIGAGCSGLSCGFQLGDFVFATPQLLGVGQNFGATTGNGENTNGRRFERSGNEYYPPYNYFPYYFPNYQQPFQQQSFPSFDTFMQQFQQFQQQQQQQQPYFPQANLGDFARFGNGASSFSSGSTNVNGNEVFSSTAVQSDPNGRVTTVYKGSGQPDVIDTRMAKPGRSNGVFASSGVNVDSNGKVTSYRAGGNLS